MTPLFKKLNFKQHPSILVLNAPESFRLEMEEMSAVTRVFTDVDPVAACPFIMAFVTRRSEVEALAPVLAQKLEGDGLLWWCYPKGSSKKYQCDFNRDNGWDAVAAAGFEPVRMVAVDEDWSALRFRRIAFIKTLTRTTALTEEGRRRIAKK